MTGSLLKLIAMVFMLIDHTSANFTSAGVNIFDPQILRFMRGMGRLSLPIFAFFIVEGYLKTKNIKKYIDRIHIFALLSQIPFMLAFFYREIDFINFSSKFIVNYDFSFIPITIFMIYVYWNYISNKKIDEGIIIIASSYILLPISISQKLTIVNNLNIFYEFGFTLILLFLIDKIISNDYKPMFVKVIILTLMIFAIFAIQKYANYRIDAIILCIFIYLSRSKLSKSLTIAIWGFYMYGQNSVYTFFVLISALLVYFYNEKRGFNLKYLFYIFYPIHLSIFALLNILIFFK